MPPRYAYWTIIAGGLPTAFRAADRDDLLPTFQRIREKHPDAQMKWFARGKLWDSPEAARARHDRDHRAQGRDRGVRHTDKGHAQRPPYRDRNTSPSARPGDRKETSRPREWRPGGDHRDPRQKFIDANKLRNATRRQQRWETKQAQPARFTPRATEHKPTPQPPRDPEREPKPNQTPSSSPTPPPRPSEPIAPAPGPPERGQRQNRRGFQPRGSYPRGSRRRN